MSLKHTNVIKSENRVPDTSPPPTPTFILAALLNKEFQK
jgi:hypothetical protein